MAKKSTNNVEAEVLEPVVEAPVEKPVEKKKKTFGIVSGCEKLNVRKAPSTESEVVEMINQDDKIEILATEDRFYKIKNGYVMQDFIKLV